MGSYPALRSPRNEKPPSPRKAERKRQKDFFWSELEFKDKRQSLKKERGVKSNRSDGEKDTINCNVSFTTKTTKYVPYIKYKYKYNNKEYTNDEISSIGASFTTEADATTYLNKYKSDSQNVYLDPKNPEDSYLYLDTNETVSTTYFIISGVILLIAILLLIFRDSSIVKLIGIAKATIFPNRVPWLIESPNITTKPAKASIIEIKPFRVIFSLTMFFLLRFSCSLFSL